MGAITKTGERATKDNSSWTKPGSNYGVNSVSIYAPGTDVLSTVPNSGYSSWKGTSMAAPFVAGVAALMLSVNNLLTAAQLKAAIINNSDTITIQIPNPNGDNPENIDQIVKRLNAFKAVSSVVFKTSNVNGGISIDGFINGFSLKPNTTLTLPRKFAPLGNNEQLNVVTIGAQSFQNNSSCNEIVLPSSVTNIESNAFDGCTSLKNIIVDPDNLVYSSCQNGILYNKNKTIIYRVPQAKNELLEIPNTVVSISNFAFKDCANLTGIVIPNSVTSIASAAFDGCTNLSSVTWNYRFGQTAAGLNLTSILTEVNLEGVTSITSNAFAGTNLTSVTIPNTVTSIGEGAFTGCANLSVTWNYRSGTTAAGLNLTSVLTEANLDDVTSISSNAFSNCTKLTSIVIPNTVTSIGSYAFDGCSGLTGSLIIPNTVTNIGSNAFTGASFSSVKWNYRSGTTAAGLNLTSILTGVNLGGISTLSANAFSNCTKLTSITDFNSVTSIGDYAFQGCSGLAALVLPNTVISIGGFAFYGCNNLIGITIPINTNSIGTGAFRGCSKLTNINLYNSSYFDFDNGILYNKAKTEIIVVLRTKTGAVPNLSGVTKIRDYAFQGCSGLTGILAIHSGVTTIGNNAFESCYGLTGLTIAVSVVSIGDSAFRSCRGLESITVDSSNTAYKSEGNCLIRRSDNTLMLGCKNSIIPNSVKIIDDYAFVNVSGLTSINIPNSVQSVGSYAFSNCNGLTDVIFEQDSQLTHILSYAFTNTKMSNIRIPQSVEHIGAGAFENCSNLKKFYIDKKSSEGLITSSTAGCIFVCIFGSNSGNETIIVPDLLTVAAYRNLTYYPWVGIWSEYKNKIQIEENDTFLEIFDNNVAVLLFDHIGDERTTSFINAIEFAFPNHVLFEAYGDVQAFYAGLWQVLSYGVEYCFIYADIDPFKYYYLLESFPGAAVCIINPSNENTDLGLDNIYTYCFSPEQLEQAYNEFGEFVLSILLQAGWDNLNSVGIDFLWYSFVDIVYDAMENNELSNEIVLYLIDIQTAWDALDAKQKIENFITVYGMINHVIIGDTYLWPIVVQVIQESGLWGEIIIQAISPHLDLCPSLKEHILSGDSEGYIIAAEFRINFAAIIMDFMKVDLGISITNINYLIGIFDIFM